MDKSDFVGRGDTEKLDCVVRAFTVATGKPYQDVHAALKAAGRKDGRKTKTSTSNRAAKALGLKRIDLKPKMTVKKFLDDSEHVPALAAFVSGHAFGVRLGSIADYVPVGPRQLVKCYYKLGA